MALDDFRGEKSGNYLRRPVAMVATFANRRPVHLCNVSRR